MPVDRLRCCPSRAATMAPRKPTHSVRCWTYPDEPGMPVFHSVRKIISSTGNTAMASRAVATRMFSPRRPQAMTPGTPARALISVGR